MLIQLDDNNLGILGYDGAIPLSYSEMKVVEFYCSDILVKHTNELVGIKFGDVYCDGYVIHTSAIQILSIEFNLRTLDLFKYAMYILRVLNYDYYYEKFRYATGGDYVMVSGLLYDAIKGAIYSNTYIQLIKPDELLEDDVVAYVGDDLFDFTSSDRTVYTMFNAGEPTVSQFHKLINNTDRISALDVIDGANYAGKLHKPISQGVVHSTQEVATSIKVEGKGFIINNKDFYNNKYLSLVGFNRDKVTPSDLEQLEVNNTMSKIVGDSGVLYDFLPITKNKELGVVSLGKEQFYHAKQGYIKFIPSDDARYIRFSTEGYNVKMLDILNDKLIEEVSDITDYKYIASTSFRVLHSSRVSVVGGSLLIMFYCLLDHILYTIPSFLLPYTISLDGEYIINAVSGDFHISKYLFEQQSIPNANYIQKIS